MGDAHHSQIGFVFGRRTGIGGISLLKGYFPWGWIEHLRIANVDARIDLITVYVVDGALGAPESWECPARSHRVVQDSLQLTASGLFGGLHAAGRLQWGPNYTQRSVSGTQVF